MKLVLTIIYFSVLFPNFSYSYIDPGTGSLILQWLIALIAGISVFFSNIKKKIINFLEKKK